MVHYGYNQYSSVKFHGDLPKKLHWEKQRKKGFWASRFVEFCKRTDLHGYKYIVMEDLSVFERSCWAIALILSIVFSIHFVVTAYKWYARNPIVTIIESTQGAIWDVPFPAVTICDLNIISKRAARVFANNVTLPANVTADFVFEALRVAPLLHSSHNTSAVLKKKLYVLQEVLDLNKISIETLFTVLSPAMSCNNLVERCMWKNTIYRCDQIFQQVFNTHNLCCTFNYYALPTNMKLMKTNNEEYKPQEPRRVASCGYQTALSVLLRTDREDYYSSMVASQGALVYIDSAYNVPNEDSPVRMVNPYTEVLIALSPARTYTTKGVKSFKPEDRQCYYSDEIKLGVFSKYSLHNCAAYTKMEVVRNNCDCVPFFFPMKEQPRICNFLDMECLEYTLKPKNESQNVTAYGGKTVDCLPECEHFDYPVEVAMGKLAKNVRLAGLPFFNNIDLTNRSLLNVFFNDLVSTRFRRDVYLNWENILAAFGGLLSLMLGFTVISGCDIILFFSLEVLYESLPEHISQNKLIKNKSTKIHDKKVNSWMDKMQITTVEKDRGIWNPVKIRSRY